MNRINQMLDTRNRLNALGEPRRYFTDSAHDTIPSNNGDWNRKRIRVRNKINTWLRARGAA